MSRTEVSRHRTRPLRADELAKHGRSRITNGDLLLFVDGRSQLYRRYRDIHDQLCADQGGGDLPEVRLQLSRRFAGAAVLAERFETKLVEGEQIDLAEYATLISSLCRLANRIGLDRIPRNVSGSLKDYLGQRSDVVIEADDGGAE